MLIKEKEISNTKPKNSNLEKGEFCEFKMAHFLSRKYKNDKNVFILNDLRITDLNDDDSTDLTFQIDHLVISPECIFLIESKSMYGVVQIEEKDHLMQWYREHDKGSPYGIRDPIIQVKSQADLLKKFLDKHAEKIFGKLLGKWQTGSGGYRFDTLVALSENAIIKILDGNKIPRELLKADAIVDYIEKLRIEYRQWTGTKGFFKDILLSNANPLAPTESRCTREITTEISEKISKILLDYHCDSKFLPIVNKVNNTSLNHPVLKTPGKIVDKNKAESNCQICSKKITQNAIDYCEAHKDILNGKLLCFNCQKSEQKKNK